MSFGDPLLDIISYAIIQISFLDKSIRNTSAIVQPTYVKDLCKSSSPDFL